MAVAAKMIFAIFLAALFSSNVNCAEFAPAVAVTAPVVAPYASSYSAHTVTHAYSPPAAPVVAAYSAPIPAAYSAAVPAAYSALPYPYAYSYVY